VLHAGHRAGKAAARFSEGRSTDEAPGDGRRGMKQGGGSRGLVGLHEEDGGGNTEGGVGELFRGSMEDSSEADGCSQ